MQIGYEVHLADEITAPAITERDVLVASSGTGKTQLTLYMAKKAFAIGAKVIAITANEESGLARYADVVISIPVPLEQRKKKNTITTVQPARSLFEQTLFVYLESCVLNLVSKLRVSQKKIYTRHLNLE
jgi:6-phospho-3-hexuloisomerase